MSNTVVNKLSEGRLQELLCAVGSAPVEDSSQIQVEEYNWNKPHYFGGDELNKLTVFTNKAASAIAEVFNNLCRGSFNVTIDSITEHFAGEFFEENAEAGEEDYLLVFGANEAKPEGFVGMPEQSAFIWTSQLLGGGETEKVTDRPLSQLEKSFLLDIALAIVKGFAQSCGGSVNSDDFKSSSGIVKAPLSLLLAHVRQTEEFCKITFNVSKTESESADETSTYILIRCNKLEAAIGESAQITDKFSSEAVSKAIVKSLETMDVKVTCNLASAMFTFEELMELKVGDILLLDQGTEQPSELVVDGRTLFNGRLVKSSGKYAILITERNKK